MSLSVKILFSLQRSSAPSPHPLPFVSASWLLSQVLLHCSLSSLVSYSVIVNSPFSCKGLWAVVVGQ